MWFFNSLFKLGGNAARKKFEDTEKPFLDHLEDLRTTLMKVIITVIVSTILAFVFNKQIIAVIQFPLSQAGIETVGSALGPVEGFMGVLKVCLYAGLICSFPLILYFIGEFVIPGLNDRERKMIIPVVIGSFVLFATGVLFAYFVVIPRALDFFIDFGDERGIPMDLRFRYAVSFVTMMCLAFGLCFELPVVVLTLVKLDLLNSGMMRRTRSYAIIAMFIISAIVTPTPDIFTMSLLAGPMILLYEICIWLAWGMERKAARAEAREKEREHKALVERQKRTKQRAEAAEAEEAGGSAAPAGALEYDPSNQASFEGDRGDDADPDSASDTEAPTAEDQGSDIVETGDAASAAQDEYHSGLEEAIESGSDAVWTPPASTDDPATTGDASSPESGHDDYHHDEYDPHHYDHQYHDDYYSGPTEELKRMLREELGSELKEDIKRELKEEILEELRKELGGEEDEPPDAPSEESNDD